MKKGINGFVIIAAFSLIGCNNYFHELIPPDGNRILSFSVQGQIDDAVISDNTVDAMVDNESPLSSLIPQITVSAKASLLPLTYEYLSAAFPNVDMLQEAAAVYEARDITEFVMDLIKRNPDFNVPVLDRPIDFTGPVNFLVVSGQGNIRQYTAHVVKDTGEPKILGFGFSKYDNPELIRDAAVTINEEAKTIQAAILYPMEMEVSYAFVLSFQIMGDRLEVEGAEVHSGIDEVQFNRTLGTQDKILTVWRKGVSANYTLTINVTEDPDSIRSIIDFRFYKADNPGISATAVGSIYNNDHLGTINVQVFYSGASPSVLTPSFLSPGTVSVMGLTQSSRINAHDFTQPIEYRVVSRNNMYVRTYTVRVDFIDITSAAPVFTSFKFSSAINHELVQDTEAQISDSAGLIMVTARYGGSFAPDMLIPDFRATGIVTVFGSVQTSGLSAQYFTRQIKYTVTNPENSLFTRDYWVQVTFIRDTSSAASINSFSFHPEDNPGLADEITGRIDQNAGTITLFAPIGSGVTSRTMFPRFRAAGQVIVNGDVQISGTSGMLFDAPVIYEAVSANGVNSKTYTVTVRELQSTIYVNHSSFGMGDGTSWTDAFRNLHDACEAAAQFPDDIPKEIWIAAGTYRPSVTGSQDEYFTLTANTSYIGGFAGNETAKSQRNIAANKVIVSGDLGGGKYSNNLFGKFSGTTASNINGHLLFEDMEFASARAAGTGDKANGGAINAKLVSGFEISVRDCIFNDLQAVNGGALYIDGGEMVISAADFENITTVDYGTVYGERLSRVEIDGITLTNRGFYFSNCSGNIEINNVDLRDISGNGVYISGGSGTREFSNITGNRIGGTYGLYVSGGSGVTLTNSVFDTCGQINVSSGGSHVRITGVEIKNVSGSVGLYASGGNTVIENVIVKNITNGTGMNIANNGSVRISGSKIKDVKSPGNTALSLLGSGSAIISDTVIENIEATGSGASAINVGMVGDLTIINSVINAVVANRCLSLSGSGNAVISNTTINNINASGGYAIYAQNRNLVIEDTVIDNNTVRYGVYGTGLSGVKIDDLALRDIGYGLYFNNCNGDIEIDNVDLQNISNDGIYINSGSGKRELSNITGYDIRGDYNVYVSGGSGDITLAESSFDTGGQIYFSNVSGSINVSDTTTKNISRTNAIYTDGRNIVIERVNVENVPNGRGIYMDTSGTGQITGSSIKNCKSSIQMGGIFLVGSGNVTISGTTIEDVELVNGGGILKSSPGNLTIRDSTIKNSRNSGNGGGIFYYGSENLTISGTTIEDVETRSVGGAIYVEGTNVSQQVNISNTMIKNVKITGTGGGGGIYYRGSGSVTISGTTIEDVEAQIGGAIYMVDNAGNLTISNSTIKNAKTTTITGSGGGICYLGSGSVTISETTIKDVETTGNYASGGAIDIGSNSSGLTISNSTIKNAKAGYTGGGINTSGSGSVLITGTTIEDAEGSNGGAISVRGNLTIRDSMIRNAKARDYGGGIYSSGSGNNVVISGTTIENVEAGNTGGAIYLSSPSNSLTIEGSTRTTIKNAKANAGGGIYYDSIRTAEITNTDFINCTAINDYKILFLPLNSTITNCTFVHDGVSDPGSSTTERIKTFFRTNGSSNGTFTFIGCTFTNLRSNEAGENYLFNSFREYPASGFGGGFTRSGNLVLRNCTFNFNAGSAGLCALGAAEDRLLMDGVTINNDGGQQPLIWLNFNNPYEFRINNVYNGTTLNNPAAITGLASSGVMRLSIGAMPALVP